MPFPALLQSVRAAHGGEELLEQGENQEEAGLGRRGGHTGRDRAGDDQTSFLDLVVTTLESQFPLDVTSGCISPRRLCGRDS